MWFSQVIKQYRKANKITQDQMQMLIKNMHRSFSLLNKTAYHRWEHGKARPSVYKRCKILTGLGLQQYVARLSHENCDKFQLLTDYINHKFASPLSSDVLYSLNDQLDYVCDTYENNLCELSRIYGKTQKKMFKTKNIEDFIKKITNQSYYSQSNLYHDTNSNNVVSHLFNVIVDFQSLDSAICEHHDGLTPSFDPLSTYRLERGTKVLFVMCSFSCTKEIFKHQLSRINTLLFANPDVSRVYIRSYDKELTNILVKLYDGKVVHKPKSDNLMDSSWSGVIFDSTLFQLSQSIFIDTKISYPHVDGL